ncbi:MAG: hypothetical protein K0R00_2619 [Herbinix sp.]|jgi:hypothetical protein|nr:hypothetical protein [Herbinix sp.]
MKKENKQPKSKYEIIKEFEDWYQKEADKISREQGVVVITPSDEDSLDDV